MLDLAYIVSNRSKLARVYNCLWPSLSSRPFLNFYVWFAIRALMLDLAYIVSNHSKLALVQLFMA